MPSQAQTPPERASVSLRFLDYLDSQPDADRIRVRATALGLTVPAGSQWSFNGTAVHDAISGASPAYHTSALTQMRDRRRALDLSATRYMDRAAVTLGASVSSEADYLSRGLSAQATIESDDRNTAWTAGLSSTRDSINPSNGVVVGERKRTLQTLLGVTQVLGTHDIVQLNLGRNVGEGYFSDPYKVFDNRPRHRQQSTFMVRWNHHLEAPGATLRTHWRHYRDSYGVRAETVALEYVQPLMGGWTVTPLARLYSQSAAWFYLDADGVDSPFAPNPPEGATYFSQDQRLSAFGARTVGVKVSRTFGLEWAADLKLERYAQRGAWCWSGSGSPGLAPFNARFLQFGLTRSF